MDRNCTMLLLLALLTFPALASAQSFQSGSDGSYGPIFVATGEMVTVDLPPDGVIHATTVTVEQFGSLKFKRNGLNTPVYLLATGEINVLGTVSVDGEPGTLNPPTGGKGGPGGFDGGMPAFGSAVPPGAGHGPGAGLGGERLSSDPLQAGVGAYATTGPDIKDGTPYGSALVVPPVGGSGGGGTTGKPGLGGGGGGGAIVVSSDSRVHLAATGSITSRGGSGASSVVGAGSGGAIRVVAPVVAGSGTLNALGPGSQINVGRIRVDTLDRSDLRLNFRSVDHTSVGTFMVVFPPALPRLDIVGVGDEIIPEGGGPVQILFPFGSDPERIVRVQARDFANVVPITIALIPESGDPIFHQAQIDMTGGTPTASVDILVTFPTNALTHVQVWTE